MGAFTKKSYLLSTAVALLTLGCGSGNENASTDDGPSITDVLRFPGTSGSLSVSQLKPNRGLAGGKTIVSIAGTGFTPGTTVAIDGEPCRAIIVITERYLACVAQPHPRGTVEVTVSKPNGESATTPAAFTYHRLGERTGS